jgi:hypothetical protein
MVIKRLHQSNCVENVAPRQKNNAVASNSNKIEDSVKKSFASSNKKQL